jgi:hypothetical protein
MSQNIVKGVLQNCTYEKKYDLNGIEFRDYVLTIDGMKYRTQIKEPIYLQNGMKIILQVKSDSVNEAIAGYCVKEGYSWGRDGGNLKNMAAHSEKYDFLEGIILEKRKSTTGSIYMNRSALSNRGSKISYTIVLGDNDFHVSGDEGEYLQVGMNIAVVLNQNDSVIIWDKDAGKYLGLSKPYFIVFLMAMILFNGYIYFSKQTPFENVKLVLIVVNVFLVLGCLLSFATFRTTNAAKKFLLKSVHQ